MVCKCKPSLFAYPLPVTQETASAAAKVPTAVLSTTARAREKAKKKEAEKSGKADDGASIKPAPAADSDAAGLPSSPLRFLPLSFGQPPFPSRLCQLSCKCLQQKHLIDSCTHAERHRTCLVLHPEGWRWLLWVFYVHGITHGAAGTAMETDEKEPDNEEAGKEGPAAAADDQADGAAPAAKEPEPSSYKLDNPSRVVPTQQKVVALEPNCRWVPIHKHRPVAGIIVLKDLRPGVHALKALLLQLSVCCCPASRPTHDALTDAHICLSQSRSGLLRLVGLWRSSSNVQQGEDVLSQWRPCGLRRGAGGAAEQHQHCSPSG